MANHVTTTPEHGELLAEISRSMVQLYKECYGKGPTKARTHISGDLVVCILEGGFFTGERTLRDAGRSDAVANQRDALQEVLRHRFVDTMEQLVGRKVRAFISGVDLQTEMNAELFVLEPEPQAAETGDGLQAIHAWAAQPRRAER